MRHFLWSLLVLAGAVAVLGLAWMYLLPYLLPFAIAVFLAVLIDPAVDRLEARGRMRRGFAVSLVLLGAGLAVGTVLTVLVAAVRSELSALIAQLPQLVDAGREVAERAIAVVAAYSDTLPAGLRELIDQQLDAVYRGLARVAAQATGALAAIGALPSAVVTALVSVVATFFISRDKRIIARFLLDVLPPAWKAQVIAAKADVFGGVIGFVKAQLTLIALTALLTLIGLNLAGARYPMTFAILVGLFDVLPVLGPGVVLLPWGVGAILLGEVGFGAKVLGVYGVVAAVRQVMEPKLVADQLGLHPLATLIALYVGLQLFGAGGVIFGPLTVLIIKALARSRLLPVFRYGADA